MSERNLELQQRLREAGEGELLELVIEYGTELDPGSARQVLKNPHISRETIETLTRQKGLLRSLEVVREVVGHPRTPEALALNLLPRMFWRDLVKLGADVKTRPRIRRAADVRLAEKLSALSVGERVAIARRAGPGSIARLRNDPSPMVIGALLENPRLTEGLLAPLLSSDTAKPEVLKRIAEDRRWGIRYHVRMTLARNPRTPVPTALGLLPGLKKKDLDSVASDWRVAAPVRKRANLLLGRD